MGKSTTHNNNFINHFSHPHRLQLIPVTSSPPCSACKLTGGNDRIFSCRPCNFFLHETCSKMKHIFTHPSHPAHLHQHRSSTPTHHTHHAGHPQHQNSFPTPNQARPRPMNRPRSIGNPNRPTGVQNVAAYRPRRRNNNLGYNGQPHLLQYSSYAHITHSHHAGHPRHQNSHVTNQAGDRHRHATRPGPPGPSGNSNSATSYGPRSHNNNLGYNGQVGPTRANELIRQERESFSQGSIYWSSYDYQTTEEFDCVVEEDEEVEDDAESNSENDVEEEEDFEDFDAEEEEFDGVGNW